MRVARVCVGRRLAHVLPSQHFSPSTFCRDPLSLSVVAAWRVVRPAGPYARFSMYNFYSRAMAPSARAPLFIFPFRGMSSCRQGGLNDSSRAGETRRFNYRTLLGDRDDSASNLLPGQELTSILIESFVERGQRLCESVSRPNHRVGFYRSENASP